MVDRKRKRERERERKCDYGWWSEGIYEPKSEREREIGEREIEKMIEIDFW